MANIITERKSAPHVEAIRKGLQRRDVRGRRTYSELGESMQGADRSRREAIESARHIDSEKNGFCKKKLFRRVARVPAEAIAWYRKNRDPRDNKDLKKWLKDQDFSTVSRRSY